ncbi:MAG: hypothetical protein TR69_WS6001001393 [candidate division WS6 bacterium OLB20]|uniref:Uncharacterized protein n=1 Tax=candidate division WS6 bacterium OLB20 TaxID=1617426 RepID=A0A136LW01_9BACT|nr:MAG: hypothetical protein TR69_WS6001001393 [candidate division WS6 bacterium OLB20]
MKKRIYLSNSLYLDFELTFVQFLVIVFMFMGMFVLPVYVYERLNAEPSVAGEQAQATPVPGSETYTEGALEQGQVAGISTQTLPEGYILIPVLDVQFDTTLNDPDSIPILAGGVLVLISTGLFVYLFTDTLFRR